MQKKINKSLHLISDALDKYERIACFCSFGKDSIVLVHLCRRIDPDIQVVSVMTPFKFKKTFEYKRKMEDEWKLNIKTYGDTREPLETYPNHNQPEECCQKYKVEPTRQAVGELELQAWISGLRRTEGTKHRQFTKEIEERDGLIKINPILHWTEADVWLYHAYYNIPPHPLYLRGYRSLGCEPCSAPYTEEERGGRWQGTDKCGGECGLHTKSLVDYFEKDEIGVIKKDVYGMAKRNSGKF